MREPRSSWERPASGLLLAVKHADLDEANARLMEQVARETETSDNPIRTAKGATAAGHEHRMRGFPIYVRGVTGVQHGAKPGSSTVKQALEHETALLATPPKRRRTTSDR